MHAIVRGTAAAHRAPRAGAGRAGRSRPRPRTGRAAACAACRRARTCAGTSARRRPRAPPDRPHAQAFVQQVPALGAREPGDGARARPRRRGGALGQRAHAGHRTPEGVRVVVTRRWCSRRHAVGVRFRGGQGFQYSCAAFVANPAAAGAQITIRSHATENPGQQRRWLSRRGPAAPRRRVAAARRGHGRGAGPQSQRRQQLADARRARCASPNTATRRYFVNGTPDRLRAPGHLRPVRRRDRSRHGRLRHQRRRQPRRRRAVFGHGGRGDRGALPRPADDRDLAGRARRPALRRRPRAWRANCCCACSARRCTRR